MRFEGLLEPERGSVEEGAEKSKGAVSKSVVPLRGTDGSNPVCSSSQSDELPITSAARTRRERDRRLGRRGCPLSRCRDAPLHTARGRVLGISNVELCFGLAVRPRDRLLRLEAALTNHPGSRSGLVE